MTQTSEPNPGEYLSISPAARLLGISTRTLQRYEASGKVRPHYLPSGHRRYLRSDLEALKASRAA